eukprot:g10880.t1
MDPPVTTSPPHPLSQQKSSSGHLSPPRRRYGGGGLTCPQTPHGPSSGHHRRAASLTAAELAGPGEGGRRSRAGGVGLFAVRSAESQERAMEEFHRPPLRRRSEQPHNARSQTPPGVGLRRGSGGATGGCMSPHRSLSRSPPRSPWRASKTEEAPGGTNTADLQKAQTAPAPAPALSTRRSSDSTVGIADSPQMLPEGLKTDEEDHGGRRVCGSGVGVINFALPAPTGIAAPPGEQAKLADTISGDGKSEMDQPPSTCESLGGDTTTQVGSFYLPGTSVGDSAGLHRGMEEVGSVGCDQAGGRGGDDDADGLEMGSEAGLTVVTTAETPAAAPATLEERAAAGGGGGGGCLLDAYREPEGNDWGELEDWQGLPGLQLAGGCGIGGATVRLQVPALIFRSGTVDEGDVLSLHGQPRSRKPEAISPAKYGGPARPHQAGRPAPAAAGHAGRQGQPMDYGKGGDGGHDGGDEAEERARVGPKTGRPRPIRTQAAARGGGGFHGFDVFDDGESDTAEHLGGWMGRTGGGSGGLGIGGSSGVGGGGGQPLLLSLADLTTAGLQKLLKAEGGSKMFFDPDSQRWVGEEVDLSGFEDPKSSSMGSASAACAAAAAAAAADGGAGSASPHRSNPRSPARISCSRSPRVGHGTSAVAAASAAPGSPISRFPANAHRRWSSGEGLYSSRRPSTVLEGSRIAAALPRTVDGSGSSGRKRPGHSRRHSVSGPTRGFLTGGSGGGGGGGVRLDGGGAGGVCRAPGSSKPPPPPTPPQQQHLQQQPRNIKPGSMASSAASSGLRSESDTGSVVRLWEDGEGRQGQDGWGSNSSRRVEEALRRASESPAAGATDPAAGPAGGGYGSGSGRKDLVVGGDQLTKSRLAQVFEGAAYASSDGRASRASLSSSRPHAPLPPAACSLEHRMWMPVRSESSPPLGMENSLASGSELGASETSDWDQDTDFECLPENQPFNLTLEQPTKFGYSPGLALGGDDSSDRAPANARAAGSHTQSDSEWPPPAATPELFRHQTAPATTATSAALGHGEAGAFMRWPLKASADGRDGGCGGGGGGGGYWHGHRMRGANSDTRADSLGSAAEWDRTLEAAVTATTIAVEHVRKRTRERLLQEKGAGGGGKRLSGPVQITLEDLQASPSPDRMSLGGGAEEGGGEDSKSSSPVPTAGGARFNRGKMCWEGFEEPDLTGFATTDSESESISRRSGSDQSRVRSRSRSRSRTPSPFGATIAEVIEEGLSPPASPELRGSSSFAQPQPAAATATGPAAAAAGALERSAASGVDGGSGGGDAERAAQSASREGDVRTDRVLMGRAGLGIVGAIDGDDGGMKRGGLCLGGGPLRGAEHRRPDVAVPRPPASSLEAAQSPSAQLAGCDGKSSIDRQTAAAAAQTPLPPPASAPGTGDGAAHQQHPSTKDQSDSVEEAEPTAAPGGGDSARRTPTSVADSSNSEDISDWDSGLRSPTPGASSGVDGGGAAAAAAAAAKAPPPLISRVSSAVFAGSPALESQGREDMMVCVQPDSAGGGGSGVAWAAGGHGRRPSSGPFLFKPVALTKEAMESMKWDETTGDCGAPPTSSEANKALVAAGARAAPPTELAKRPPHGSGGLGSDYGGKESTGSTVLLSKGDAAGAESGSGSASEAAASGEGAGETRAAVAAVPTLAAAVVSMGDDATKVSASVAAVASTVAVAGSRKEPRAAGKVQGMVYRRIYGGPTEAVAQEGGDNDARASMSHKTKSTEDYSVDDWGADFVGGIVLTPKTGGPGSTWGRAQEALEECDEDTDDSPDRPKTSRMMMHVAPLPPAAGHSQEHVAFDACDDQSAWSAPELSNDRSTSDGDVGGGGGGGGGASIARGHRRTFAMMNTAFTRASSKHMMFIRRRNGGGGRVDGGSSSEDEDEDGDSGSGNGAAREGRRGPAAGSTRRRTSSKRRRPRRTRGFQTISKEEYTPMYVPTAWLNPDSNRWEPVDGYAVDMSGFGSSEHGDDGDDNVDGEDVEKSLSDPGTSILRGPQKAASPSQPPPPPPPVPLDGSGRGGWGVGEEGVRNERTGSLNRPLLSRERSGQSMSSSVGTGTGTPTSQGQTRRRTSALEDRFAAFRLAPATLQHLARSEQAHDEAMTRFLGEQGYARAKREGAARLLRLPGVAAMAAEDSTASPSKRKQSHQRPGRASAGETSGKGSSDARSSGVRGTTKSRARAGAGEQGTPPRRTSRSQPNPALCLFPGTAPGPELAPGSSTQGDGASSGGGSGLTTPSGGGSSSGRRRSSSRPGVKEASSSPSPARGGGPVSAGQGGTATTTSGASSGGTPLRSRKAGGAPTTPVKGTSPSKGRLSAPPPISTRRTSPYAFSSSSSRRGVSSVSPAGATKRPTGGASPGSSGRSPAAAAPAAMAAAASRRRRSPASCASRGTSPKLTASQQVEADRRRSSRHDSADSGSRVAARRRAGSASSASSPVGEGKSSTSTGGGRSPSGGGGGGGGASASASNKVAGGLARRSRSDSAATAASASVSNASTSSPDRSARRPSNASGSRRRGSGSKARSASAQWGTPDAARSSSLRRDASGGGSAQRRRSEDTAAASTSSAGGGGGGGRRSARNALSPRLSSRVLRSPPRRELGADPIMRRATIASPPMSPRAVRLQRTASSGRMSSWRPAGRSWARAGGGGGSGSGSGGHVQDSRRGGASGARAGAGGVGEVSAEAVAAAAALAERERAGRRLDRFRYMAEFAANTVKERFSLFGGRTSAEVPFTGDLRRGHRRRRSGGESSTGGASVGSGSSAGLGSMVGLTTVWR